MALSIIFWHTKHYNNTLFTIIQDFQEIQQGLKSQWWMMLDTIILSREWLKVCLPIEIHHIYGTSYNTTFTMINIKTTCLIDMTNTGRIWWGFLFLWKDIQMAIYQNVLYPTTITKLLFTIELMTVGIIFLKSILKISTHGHVHLYKLMLAGGTCSMWHLVVFLSKRYYSGLSWIFRPIFRKVVSQKPAVHTVLKPRSSS